MKTKKVELPNYGILDITLDKEHLDHLHHLVEKYEPDNAKQQWMLIDDCLLYTSPSPRDKRQSRMPSSA